MGIHNSGGSKPAHLLVNGRRLAIATSLVCAWFLAYMLPGYKNVIKQQIETSIRSHLPAIPKVEIDYHPSVSRNRFNSSKLALLIESRPVPTLVPQLLHMISVIPSDWKFLFLGSNSSVRSVGRSLPTQYHVADGKLELKVVPSIWADEIPPDTGTGPKSKPKAKAGSEHGITKEGIYRMMTDIRFYDEVIPGVEWLLKFEFDSIMCANSEISLNDWLDFTWAGSPRSNSDPFAGNGGLSYRRISIVKQILAFQERFNDSIPEDEWFGQRVSVLPGIRVANAMEEEHFSVESVWHERPMGYHVRGGGHSLAPEVWNNKNQRLRIFEYCPEISMIMPMKLERERCPGDDGSGNIDKAIFDEAIVALVAAQAEAQAEAEG